MTITTEEAEELAKAAFGLMDDPPDPDDEIMLGSDFLADLATALRSLAAERDALQARVAELDGALRPFAELGRFVVEHHPDPETDLNHEMSALVRHFRNAHTALEGKKE